VNGFRASVESFGREVALSISRKKQFAIYRVRGRVSADGDLDARFGSLGRISVAFEPDAVAHHPCREEIEGVAGTFAGTIEFIGEQRYVRFQVDQARGHAYIRGQATGCKQADRPAPPRRDSPATGEEEAEETDTAALSVYEPGKRRQLLAVGERPPNGRGYTYFFGALGERRGPMRVARGIVTVASPRTFLFDSSLASATVRPPKPFQGEGTFRRDPDGSPVWTGSITAPILGAGRIVVAGPGFAAKMVRETPGD
jgi:hypothetical protein